MMMMMIITTHVAQIVNTEQLQHYKHGLFQVYNCKYPHKGGNKDDDDDNDDDKDLG